MKPSDFLTELSNDKLTQYKTAAAADASKADKEGDFKKGDKRFSGIVKATKKQFDNDAKKDVAEGDVVPFPKKHPYELLTNCPKCGGSLQGGKDEKGRLKMCIPCMTLYRAPIQQGVAEGILGSDPNRGQKVPDWAKRGIVGKIGRKLDPAWSDVQMTVPQHLLSKQSSEPTTNSLATKDMPKATSITPTRAILQRVMTKPSHPVTKNGVTTIADKQGVAEGLLNEFARGNGGDDGDDGEEFNPDLAKMAQEHGFTKGVSLADGSSLATAFKITKWDQASGGLYKQYFVQGFKEGRMDKINHDNKQYNLNLKLMKDGSIRHGEQGVAEGWSQKYKSSINCSHPKGFSQKAHCAGKKKHNESIEMEMVCEDCGMCETHSDHENLDEACWKGYHKEGNKKMFGKTYPNCVKNTNEEQEQHSDSCPHCGGELVSEELINEKKDACYYKVKSRYKVWPSAYASGALVKCRKKGADNWGNGSKNESSILEGIEQADESLHDWFNKEKWVRMDTKGNIKGPCAKEPGEGKPKCLPQAKAHSLGKKGRASAAARKRREDPNPDRSGKAINVNTKKD